MGGVLCLSVGVALGALPQLRASRGIGVTAGAGHLYRLFMCITAVYLAVPQKPKLTPSATYAYVLPRHG